MEPAFGFTSILCLWEGNIVLAHYFLWKSETTKSRCVGGWMTQAGRQGVTQPRSVALWGPWCGGGRRSLVHNYINNACKCRQASDYLYSYIQKL